MDYDKTMNNEKYNQIIGEVYTEYCKWYSHVDEKTGNVVNVKYPNSKSSKEEFIFRIKSDKEFAEVWGLTIGERELSLEERYGLIEKDKHIQYQKWESLGTDRVKESLDSLNIPTRAISITYNNETIEVYEN